MQRLPPPPLDDDDDLPFAIHKNNTPRLDVRAKGGWGWGRTSGPPFSLSLPLSLFLSLFLSFSSESGWADRVDARVSVCGFFSSTPVIGPFYCTSGDFRAITRATSHLVAWYLYGASTYISTVT